MPPVQLETCRVGMIVRPLCSIIIMAGCLVTGLRDVRITVPKAARRGDSAVLHCLYDLEGDPLYAVKWYKGRAEFFRYTPKEKPPMKLFQIQGLSDLIVDRLKSNETQVYLNSVTTAMSGQYNCEVSADAPSFHTAIVASNMEVVEVPLKPPVLTGLKSRFRLRDTLRANCTAAPSRPAVNLTWGLNGENVNPRWVKQYRRVVDKSPSLEQSMSLLEVNLRRYHVTSGKLEVRCMASLYDLYWQTTEATVETEVTDNEVADKNSWEDYDDDDDVVTSNNVVVTGFPTQYPTGSSRASTYCLRENTWCIFSYETAWLMMSYLSFYKYLGSNLC